MSIIQEEQARISAVTALIDRYPEEFSRLLREAATRTVMVKRTMYREVTEEEAEILSKYGWEIIDD